MALDLNLDVIVNGAGAREELRKVEDGIKGVASAAKQTEAPVSKVMQAMVGQSGATDRVTQATSRLDAQTKRLNGELRVNHEFLDRIEASTRAQTSAVAASTASYGTLAAGLAAVGVVLGAEIKFLYDSGRAYLEKSGILANHEQAIDRVREAWERMQFRVGQALLGNGADFTSWLDRVAGGLDWFAERFETTMRRVKTAAHYLTLGEFRDYLPGGDPPGVASARVDVNGDPTAYGLMVRNQERMKNQNAQNRADFLTPADGFSLTRQMDAEDRAREREAERAANAASKAAERAAEKAAREREAEWQKLLSSVGSMDKFFGYGGWFQSGGNTDSERLQAKLGGSATSVEDLLAISQATGPRGFFQSGQTYWDRIAPLGESESELGGLNFGHPGGFFQAGTVQQSPGFFQGGFGSSAQFGSALSGTILQSITGGGSMVGGIGSLLGGGLGSSIAKSLTTGVNAITGFAGGALNAILPGVGALLGPALSGLFGKLFGGMSAEERADKEYELKTAKGAYQRGDLGAGASIQRLEEDLYSYKERTRADMEERRSINAGVDVTSLKQQAQFTGRMDLFDAYMGSRGSNSPEYLKQVLGELNEQTQFLTSTMQKYGISWEDAGEAAKQSQIDLLAKDLILEFDVLQQAGFGVDFIIEKMGGSINDFIASAKRTGTEVPFAMKPMLQQMIDMGLITDDSGEKFDSLEETGIVFSKTMSELFEGMGARMEKAIDRVAIALGYVFDEYDGKELHVPVRVDGLPGRGGGPGIDEGEADPNGDGAQTPQFAMGTRGYQYFGSGTRAILHGWEKVTPLGAGEKPQTVHVHVHMNDYEVAEALVDLTKRIGLH